jgi:antitoxin MazE
MKTKLSKWGNSLAVRIPSSVAAQASLSPGSSCEVTYANGSLLLTPIEDEPGLDELLEQITPENRHEESDWGASIGREAW